MLMNEFAPQINDAVPHDVIPTAPTIVAETVEETKPQDKVKQDKPKRNFWADASPKKEDDSDDSALKTFKYP